MSKPKGFDFDELQKELYHKCKIDNFDFTEIHNFNSKLFSLAKNITLEKAKKLFAKIQPKFWNNLLKSLDVAELLNESDKMTPKQKSLLNLYLYLNIIEGIVSENVTLISFLLVQNGHDIYDPRRMKFAESYGDLEKIEFYIKLQFLERHELDFYTNAIDRELRNCIAHQDFLLYDNGNVKNQKTGKEIDINKKVEYICTVNSLVQLALYQLIDIIDPKEMRAFQT